MKFLPSRATFVVLRNLLTTGVMLGMVLMTGPAQAFADASTTSDSTTPSVEAPVEPILPVISTSTDTSSTNPTDVSSTTSQASVVTQQGQTTPIVVATDVSTTTPVLLPVPKTASTTGETVTGESCVFSSNERTQAQGDDDSDPHNSVLVTPINSAWQTLPDHPYAKWIWGDTLSDSEAQAGTSYTFTKSFTYTGSVNAKLHIAADNGFEAWVNGILVVDDSAVGNTFSDPKTYDISADLIPGQVNTLVVTVTNFPGGDALSNPAGLIYAINLDKTTTCDDVLTPPRNVTVHIRKYMQNGDSVAQVPNNATFPSFPMTATWSWLGAPQSSGTYELGDNFNSPLLKYAANTSPMPAPADYATSEITDGNVVLAPGAECSPGKFRLVGYKVGKTLAEAKAADISTTSPSFVDLRSGEFVLVVNEQCPTAPEQCTLVSDTTTNFMKHVKTEEDPTVVPQPSVHVTPLNAAWTAVLDGASWIWGENPVARPVKGKTERFVKTFTLDSVPTGADLMLAADNSYSVTVNGNDVASSSDEDNYSLAGQDHITIPGSDLKKGKNTLSVTVKNWAMTGGTPATNPGGLLYTLTINGASCLDTTPPPTTLKVHIYKFLGTADQSAQIPNDTNITYQFPMTATWNASNLDGGATTTGTYVLGNGEGQDPIVLNYQADTEAMQAPANYSTSEITSDVDGSSQVLPTDATCVPGKFRLVGYKVGSTLEDAEAASVSSTVPDFTGLTSDESVIVVNEQCASDTGGDTGGSTVVTSDSNTSQGTSGSTSGGTIQAGQVLGASIGPVGKVLGAECGPTLTSYLRQGKKNPVDQVQILQNFLNGELGLHLPVTGYFGPATYAAVINFQAKYAPNVLTPWAPFSPSGKQDPTGYVYKTTKHEINMISCPTSGDVLPSLP